MNECGCGCGCKIKLRVDDESPIGLQIIDGETVRVGCADFLIRTDKDYNHLENKPSINDVTLEGNKTLEELGIDLDAKLDKPPMTGQSNGFLKNNLNGGDPEWTIGMYAHEQVPSEGHAGFTELSLGNNTDYKTAPYGRYGVLRLIFTDGSKRGIVGFMPAPPLVEGQKTSYYFVESNHASSDNYMLSSPNRDNTTGRLAKFDDGTSITESELTEEDINNKLDKPPETGVGNGLLRNNNGGDPSWTVGASIFEQVPNGSGGAGYAQLTLGNAEDYRTPPYGRYGTLRLIMTDGDKRGITVFGVAPPLVSGEKRAYYFLESNHAQTNNYLLSSANRDNTTGKLAVFTEGTSIASGTLAESDIELKANKVTSLSSSSTDTEYPSAKAVYDAIQAGSSAEARHLTLTLENGTYYLEDEDGVRLTPEAFEDIPIGNTDISTPSLVSKDYYQVVYYNVKLQLLSKKYTLILANISDAYTLARARLITLTSQGDNVVYAGTAEDYPLLDDTDYAKLSGIEDGAEVNTIDTVKVNGTALTPDANKAVDISVPAAQVNSDWNAVSGVAQILNKPTIPDVEPLSSAEIDLICV